MISGVWDVGLSWSVLPLGLGGTSGVLGIKLLLLMNLPLESLSLCMSLFLGGKKQNYLVFTSPATAPKISAQLSVPKLMS